MNCLKETKPIQLAVLVLSLLVSGAGAAQWSAELEGQWSLTSDSGDIDQQELQLDIRFEDKFAGGKLGMIARLRGDFDDALNPPDSAPLTSYADISRPFASGPDGQAELRELWWQRNWQHWQLSLGKQQVVWGEADGIKLLDVINPQSFREFILDDFEDSRIPLWMANVRYQFGPDLQLQLLLIPDTTVHELPPAGSPFAFSAPSLVLDRSAPSPLPVDIQSADAPGDGLRNGDAGLRLSGFAGGWDYSLSYLNHIVDSPVFRGRVDAGRLVISEEYLRSNLWGVTASNVLGDVTLRLELAYETDRELRVDSAVPGTLDSDLFRSVIGLDWLGLENQLWSLQYFQTTVVDHEDTMFDEQREDIVTLLWRYSALNDTLGFEWQHIYSTTDADSLAQLRVDYNWSDSLDLFIGADIFSGDSPGLFGQFDHADRVSTGFTLAL